jgi:hypothetical protein
VKLTEAWRSTVVAAPNAVTTAILQSQAVDRTSRGQRGIALTPCEWKGGTEKKGGDGGVGIPF